MNKNITHVLASFFLLSMFSDIAISSDNSIRPNYPKHDSPIEYFKYGSIGLEMTIGVPYYIWSILPGTFPQHLPITSQSDDYQSFGFVYESGKNIPIGISKVSINNEPYVSFNCSSCHTATWRSSQGTKRQYYVGGPSSRYNLLAYIKFLSNVGNDPAFTPDILLKNIEKRFSLTNEQKKLYLEEIIPETKIGLKHAFDSLVWTQENNRPTWGPGQIDPFNPAKFTILKIKDDGSIGNSDMMAIWNMSHRERIAGTGKKVLYHWDGLADNLRDVVISSLLGSGANANSFPMQSVSTIKKFMSAQPAPKYPYSINKKLANKGLKIFTANCADCHGDSGKRTLSIIPIKEIGTDNHRLGMWTEEAREAYTAYNEGYTWDLHFLRHQGYVAPVLDGIWLRAPYLHNGSVPTLSDLLLSPKDRPKKFYRGFDVYDSLNVGFVTEGEGAKRDGFLYDTSLPSHSNQGHSYGLTLSPNEKNALIEYLKTL